MNAEDRLNRALKAPAAPAKDLHFTLQVMREAESARFRAEAMRRLLWGAMVAALAVTAGIPIAGWAAESPDATLDMGLAAGGILALLSVMRALRLSAPARAR